MRLLLLRGICLVICLVPHISSAATSVFFERDSYIVENKGTVFQVKALLDGDDNQIGHQTLGEGIYSFGLALFVDGTKASVGSKENIVPVKVLDNDGFDTGLATKVIGTDYVAVAGVIGFDNLLYGPDSATSASGGTWPLIATFTITNLVFSGQSYTMHLGLIPSSHPDLWTYSLVDQTEFVPFDLKIEFGETTIHVGTPPSIATIPDQSGVTNSVMGPIPLDLVDKEWPAADLSITVVSSNPDLLPARNVTFFTQNGIRKMVLTPAENETGSSLVELSIQDDLFTVRTSFMVYVGTGEPAPPRFIEPTFGRDGSFTAGIASTPGVAILIESSTDLQSWVPFRSLQPLSSRSSFEHPEAAGLTHKFFRIKSPP